MSIVVAITGASGAIYGARFVRALAALTTGQSRLIVSPTALRVYNEEYGTKIETPAQYLEAALGDSKGSQSFVLDDFRDVGGKPASGSTPSDGMVIVPCSMKTLAAIAHGYTTNLIERGADVCLKERRRLVVVPRESPYSLIHLRNMTSLTEAGGIVLPASPGFYQRPQNLEDLGDFIAGRILGLFGVPHQLFKAWLTDS
ncbi:MAG: UbiX family flavin prenyltransferase [Spirochaetales bacterium]|nr:UbiX family flavin prenyltransferase [Leptospiraceae bacterium]MCP5481822.1 UbiX family flavin prenyltransferase [Spirochaetales bacterium]